MYVRERDGEREIVCVCEGEKEKVTEREMEG